MKVRLGFWKAGLLSSASPTSPACLSDLSIESVLGSERTHAGHRTSLCFQDNMQQYFITLNLSIYRRFGYAAFLCTSPRCPTHYMRLAVIIGQQAGRAFFLQFSELIGTCGIQGLCCTSALNLTSTSAASSCTSQERAQVQHSSRLRIYTSYAQPIYYFRSVTLQYGSRHGGGSYRRTCRLARCRS